MGDTKKKEDKKKSKQTAAKKEEKKIKAAARQNVISTFSKGEKRILNHKSERAKKKTKKGKAN